MAYGVLLVLALSAASDEVSAAGERGSGGAGAGGIGEAEAVDATAGTGAVGVAGRTTVDADPFPFVAPGAFGLNEGRGIGGGLDTSRVGRGLAGVEAADKTGAGDFIASDAATGGFAGSVRAAGVAGVVAEGGADVNDTRSAAGAMMPRLIEALMASLRFIGPGVGRGIGGTAARTGAATVGRVAVGATVAGAAGVVGTFGVDALAVGVSALESVFSDEAGTATGRGITGADVGEFCVAAGVDIAACGTAAGVAITDADGATLGLASGALLVPVGAAFGDAVDATVPAEG